MTLNQQGRVPRLPSVNSTAPSRVRPGDFLLNSLLPVSLLILRTKNSPSPLTVKTSQKISIIHPINSCAPHDSRCRRRQDESDPSIMEGSHAKPNWQASDPSTMAFYETPGSSPDKSQAPIEATKSHNAYFFDILHAKVILPSRHA